MSTSILDQQARAAAARYGEQTGLWSWLTTVDHKRIGILYGATAFVFFLLGGLEALVIRLQLVKPNNDLVGPDFYNQLFTMHGVTMIFLVVIPLSIAVYTNYMIPLMIGARDVAFPRLNAFSYWVFLFGGLFLNAGFLIGAAPNAGWFGYANLTSKQFSPGPNIDFWALGLIQLVGVSSLAAGVNFFVTIINLRAPNMKLMRMPMFVWMNLFTQVLALLAFPVFVAALILLTMDRFVGTHFYVPQGSGDPILWEHLFWIFGHPEVYIMALPAFGVISEVVPVFSRKPLYGYGAMVFSGAFIAFLSYGVWGHHMFATGMGAVPDTVFALTSMLIAIPTGVKIFNWLGTIWGGSLQFKTPMYFALGFLAMFTIGGLSGVMHSVAPHDLQQTDTYFVVAHFHYVLFGGSLFGLTAGAYYWWPKMFGRMLDERLGKLHFWLMLIGFNLTFFPMHFLGLNGMPRRVYTYQPGLGFEWLNQIETVGAFLIALSFVVFIYNAVKTWRSGQQAPADPWDGATLEWSIPSPPPEWNFDEIPTVECRDPLWRLKHKRGGPLPEPTRGNAEGIHIPPPSYWPLVTAVGVSGIFVGILVSPRLGPWGVVAGMAVLFFGFFNWMFEKGYSDFTTPGRSAPGASAH